MTTRIFSWKYPKYLQNIFSIDYLWQTATKTFFIEIRKQPVTAALEKICSEKPGKILGKYLQ